MNDNRHNIKNDRFRKMFDKIVWGRSRCHKCKYRVFIRSVDICQHPDSDGALMVRCNKFIDKNNPTGVEMCDTEPDMIGKMGMKKN